MRVFAEKGYEQTTMRDIASAVGVVPGLCYRYFESKQVLFEQAVRQYVSDYCAPIVRALKEHSGDMSSAFDRAAALFDFRQQRKIRCLFPQGGEPDLPHTAQLLYL
ncbi:TetR/AcrR family transcriptional regulator; helix-turn-helix transcriptional regulator [Blautia sp. RD014234]|nr:TetR/AcrR family transcriptional regulator; helix-turn-helix transcriptional regulator [Blautia parvula]